MAVKKWSEVTEWSELQQVIGVKDLCRVLHISKPTALKYLRNGTIPAVRLGNEWRIDKDALKALLSGKEKVA